jgi:hypothetical protein
MAKKPAEFLVNVYSLVNATPDASFTVTTPIVTPTSALAETVNLSMLIAMNFSALGEDGLDITFVPVCQFKNAILTI